MPILNLATHDADRGTVAVRWRFDLDPEMVWTGLTDPVWLRRWLGTPLGGFAVGEPVGPGGTIRLDHGDGLVQTSVVRGCRLWRHLEVTWAFPGEPLSVVDVTLEPAGPIDAAARPFVADPVLAAAGEAAGATASGTDLTLSHLGVGAQAREYAIAWHTHLLYLAAALRASPMPLDRFWEVHERVARAYYR
nr:hypothetical protein [Propionibacterium sp.]